MTTMVTNTTRNTICNANSCYQTVNRPHILAPHTTIYYSTYADKFYSHLSLTLAANLSLCYDCKWQVQTVSRKSEALIGSYDLVLWAMLHVEQISRCYSYHTALPSLDGGNPHSVVSGWRMTITFYLFCLWQSLSEIRRCKFARDDLRLQQTTQRH